MHESIFVFVVTMRPGALLIGLPVLNSRNRSLLWGKVNSSNRMGCLRHKLTCAQRAPLF